MKAIKQPEAVSHIKHLLRERGLDIPSRSLTGKQWVIFEHQGKQLGIDSGAGIWVRSSNEEDWRCVAMPCTVSQAIQAIEFLIH